jgi:hypothetical protein
MFGKAGNFRSSRAGLAAHQRVELQSQRAFGILRKEPIELVGHDKSQNAIAQKLQPLIGACRIGARMGQRAFEKVLVLERMAKLRCKRIVFLSQ